jgi:hypothetical protein
VYRPDGELAPPAKGDKVPIDVKKRDHDDWKEIETRCRDCDATIKETIRLKDVPMHRPRTRCCDCVAGFFRRARVRPPRRVA